MTTLERLRDKANSLPETPGVYLMKNRDGAIIYVGKSKKLKNRVTSYFTGNHHTPKTERMVSLVADFDYILCHTEIEALTLENVLIKKHTPKYNIKLKDAKSYPYIKVTNEEYPKLFVTRERKSDRARYYGPYQGSAGAHAALEAVSKIFTLAVCKRSFPRDIGRDRPCLLRDMGRCVAPCTGRVSAEEYRDLVRRAESVLDGNIRETAKTIEEDMYRAAEAEEYERAATLRDSLRALEMLREKQKVVSDEHFDRDVFALFVSDTESVLSLLSVRGGALVNKNEFILSADALTEEDGKVSLIASHYETSGRIPREVLLAFPLSEDALSLLTEYLCLLAGHRVAVRTPERGDGRRLCELAEENAAEAARQYRLEGEREDKSLARLATLLGLPELPRRMEAYDISNYGNEAITASMVVYESGRLKKSDYRLFRIKTTEGADDYASMREALSRRLSHIGDGSASLGETPDVLLIDGGAAHVHAVREVLAAMNLEIPTYGMVKDDFHKTRALTDGEKEISIATEMPVYALIFKIQEEAHRFAVGAASASKRRGLTHSTLEKIEGIGPAKAKLLLSKMPLAKVKTSSAKELAKIKGISEKDAENVYNYFHKEKKS